MQSWLTQAQSQPATNTRGGAINGAPYQPGPASVVVESSNAISLRIALQSYGESGRVPHFTLDPFTKEVIQHVDLQLAAVKVTDFPVEPHRFGQNVWVSVLNPSGQALDPDQSHWVGEKVGMIARAVGADRALYEGERMAVGELISFNAVAFAKSVPMCHTPDPKLEIGFFQSGLDGSLAAIVEEALEQIEDGETEGSMTTEDFKAALEAEIEDRDVMVEVEVVDVAPEVYNANVVEVEADNNEDVVETILGDFPGRKVKLGSGGKAVTALNEAFGLGGKKFDEELEDHVKMIQELAGLEVTGEVDSDTWDAIDAHLLEEEQQ